MPVQCEVKRLTKSTGASGTTQDLAFSFTPKAIIVFSVGAATAASTLAENQYSIGFSDGTSHGCVAYGSVDNAAAGTAGRIHRNDAVFVRLSQTAPATTLVCRGSCVFQPNNVRFTWDVNDAVATIMTVWAIAGTDIQAKVATTTIGRTTAGSQDYTGLGFTPRGASKTVIFTLCTALQTANTLANDANIMFGCGTELGANNRSWYYGGSAENISDPSDTWRYGNNDRNFAVQDALGNFYAFGYLIDWLADGFRMFWDSAPANASTLFTYLVIDGGTWFAGATVGPATATNDVVTPVNVNSNQIRGMIIGTIVNSVIASPNGTISDICTGATDGTTQSFESAIDEDAQATTDSYRRTDSVAIAYGMTTNGTARNIVAFDRFGTNSFQLDHTTSLGANSYYFVVVADETPAPHSYGKIHVDFDNNLGGAVFG
jgi:hypothetical protein